MENREEQAEKFFNEYEENLNNKHDRSLYYMGSVVKCSESDVIDLMVKFNNKYSDQQNKSLLEEIERLKQANQQQESDIKRLKSIQSQETTRADELQNEVERLKKKLESKNDECNEYATNCNKYHNLYLSKDGENKQLQIEIERYKKIVAQPDWNELEYVVGLETKIEQLQSELKAAEWISVENRLPEKDVSVIICCKDREFKSDEHILKGWITGTKYWCSLEGNEDEDLIVTHWMPLPNNPKTN